MLLNRPKSSRLLSRGKQQEGNEKNVASSTTSVLGSESSRSKLGSRRSSRSSSGRRDEKLPSLAQVNKEIMDQSSELLGKTGLTPDFLAKWISDKRGDIREVFIYYH